jgi:GntR family transcriptional regulator
MLSGEETSANTFSGEPVKTCAAMFETMDGMDLDDLGTGDARPLHQQMAQVLRLAIEDGRLTAGDRVPGENALMSRYGVARWTAREALAALAQEGLVTKVPGLGTFVREPPRTRRYGMERYARRNWQNLLVSEAERQGRAANRVVRELAEVPAPAPVAERLGIAVGTIVWVRRRTVFIDGRPNQVADSYYPLAIARGTRLAEAETGLGGDFGQLAGAGHEPGRVREEWTARMPTHAEAELLGLGAGRPVMDLVRTTFDLDGDPVEVMLSAIAADTASVVFDIPISD